MGARSGIYWFDGPGEYAQRLSIAAEELDGKADAVVREVVDRAADRMRDIINAGGVNPTKKGGPRRLSDRMYNSVDSNMFMNKRGRAQGEFGFIDNPPQWTKWQEDGTQFIPSMKAFATALIEAEAFFQDKIDSTSWLPRKI